MEIEKLLASFHQITLDQAHVDIPNRMDRKFVIKKSNLTALLLDFRQEYDLLGFGGKILLNYETTYFDTTNRKLYLDHHNSVRPRSKIRYRKYLTSGDNFLELKIKTNQSVTYKIRKPIENGICLSEIQNFASEYLSLDDAKLEPTLTNTFHRLFLVKKDKTMRMTIDIDLSIRKNKEAYQPLYSELAIVEIKANKEDLSGHYSSFKKYGLIATRFSKYCLALIALEPHLKHNEFKPTLQKLSTICKL